MGNQFGRIFRITTFGESHGKAVGVLIDGCPSNIKINFAEVQSWLQRRRPAQSEFTSQRREADTVECLSGLENGVTLGTPLALVVYNHDQRPADYDAEVLRPSHADYSYLAKYGVKSKSGGGRASARETVGRVAAGAIAAQVSKVLAPKLQVLTWVESVSDVACAFSAAERAKITREAIEATAMRCPDLQVAKRMQETISKVQAEGDTVGGCLATSVRGCPVGLGEPVFDKLEAQLAKAMLSIPATKGFEIGAGFAATKMRGTQHNDQFTVQAGKVRTTTNMSGGIQGGISNGEEIFFRVACKPVSTVFKEQQALDTSLQPINYKPNKGRHDPCVLPRAVVIVEAMCHLVLLDMLLLNLTQQKQNHCRETQH